MTHFRDVRTNGHPTFSVYNCKIALFNNLVNVQYNFIVQKNVKVLLLVLILNVRKKKKKKKEKKSVSTFIV